ncbi:Fructosamine-3-kinase [Chitinophaga costaii]|uniref:Fructosamine-3-kinase n=1 Tax=Chitinophaga costaii TaxID=1335309 RepID=A0A1C4E951_9BACT|nr:fructosamine kinase family protein [Chitinophaga costaii]PUZ24240.1 fructosamine kinase [Chitinophaga costaii]SCC40070.1 Fructosamine-3-kinase [Chitinophaga costaii]
MMDETLLTSLSAALSRQLGVKIQINRTVSIAGGDINDTYRVESNEGQWFLKMNNATLYPSMFAKEYDGLQTLGKTNAIKVPKPLLYGTAGAYAFLVTELITKTRPVNDFWENFAASLAQLHRQSNSTFGYHTSNYIGNLKQYNTAYSSWPVFYAMNRLLPLAREAFDQQKMDKETVQQLEQLCKRLPEIFPAEPPALLHGDLWSGNFMVGDHGKACIYDPAVYYGHREIDLAMTRLFGGFDTRFHYAYQAIYPLSHGWQSRIGICQLYPLLVHYLLFGGSYYADIKAVLQAF